MNKILIADDAEFQRELYAAELTEEGYEVDLASNGKEALSMLTEKEYDAVILDIRMPDMDGIEALGIISSYKKNMPVIIHTAYSNYKGNFLTWAANAYITKSSDLSNLKDKVREILMECPQL